MAVSSGMAMISSAKMSLEHPLHEHALTLREITKDCRVKCRLCEQSFHGPTYCCELCDFILHKPCAQIEFPPLIQDHSSHRPGHPLSLVHLEHGRSVYCCSDCRFSLGVLTAIATRRPPRDVEEETVWHFSHGEHPLSSFRVETVLEVPCVFCEQQIRAGQVYGCRSCLFLLHEACARLTHKIQHPLHRQHPLSIDYLLKMHIHQCKVCGVYVPDGYCCDCEECKFSLHVECTVLTMPARNGSKKDTEEEDSSSTIEYYFHEHPLTPIHVRELVQSRIWCTICGLTISGGEALACSDSCRFFLHKSCVIHLPKEIKHYLHPQHPRLVLGPSLPYTCGCCQGNGSDVAFSCEDCEFNLHPACAFQTLSAIEDGAVANISWFGHEHPLTLAFRFSGRRHNYSACKEPIDGPTYCCLTCKMWFWFHRSCVELPLELEHAISSTTSPPSLRGTVLGLPLLCLS